MRMAHGQNRISAHGGDRTGEASDAASFTTVRIVSGALVLVVLYTGRSAGTGALLLFGAAGFTPTPARSAAR